MRSSLAHLGRWAAVKSMYALLSAVHYHEVCMSAKDNRAEKPNRVQAHSV